MKYRVPPARMAKAFVFAFLLSSSVYAACPVGSFGGKELEPGIYQLTAVDLDSATKRPLHREIADPAPPLINDKGQVEIYGTGDAFVRYDSWQEFEKGGCYHVVPMELRFLGSDQSLKPSDPPWDLRKFLVKDGNQTKSTFLLGGAMTPGEGRDTPAFPEDNVSRRVFAFYDSAGAWVRSNSPVFGDPSTGWLGHSYGGNILQPDTLEPNVVRTDNPAPTYLFYEKVSDTEGGGPHRTEIFARPLSGVKAEGSETSIFAAGDNPYPAVKRIGGGALAEGPRPIQVNLSKTMLFLVGFSTGDFPTDHYGINFLWSKNPLGPFEPFLNAEKNDLEDFGAGLKEKFGLSWVGRPAIYQRPDGKFEMLFHGVVKNRIPDNDYSTWPRHHALQEFVRSIFKVAVNLSLDANGKPTIAIPHVSAAKIP